MDDFTVTRVSAVTAVAAPERVTAFLRTVYGWMFIGLGVTAAVVYTVADSPAIMQTIASNHVLFVGALIAELGLVFYLSAWVQSLAPNAATTLFLLYSASGTTMRSSSSSPLSASSSSPGLTAWGAQRLRQMAGGLLPGQRGSYAIVGALSLYLNFINLFLILLRFQGGWRT